MEWFRLYAEMVDDPKIGTLPDDQFRVWIELLCIACEARDKGDTGLDVAGLSWRLRRDATEMQRLCNALATLDLIRCNADTIVITSWAKRQFVSDSSTLRSRKHRATLLKRCSNGSATAPDTDTDTDQIRTDQSTDSSEPPKTAASEPALLTVRTIGQQTEWHLTQSIVDDITSAYPGVDVLAEARKAKAWIDANPDKRKTAKGMRRFLTSWINRGVDSGKVARMARAKCKACEGLGSVKVDGQWIHCKECGK